MLLRGWWQRWYALTTTSKNHTMAVLDNDISSNSTLHLIDGGSDNDVITVTASVSNSAFHTLDGGAGNDSISGYTGKDYIDGGTEDNGNDTIISRGGMLHHGRWWWPINLVWSCSESTYTVWFRKWYVETRRIDIRRHHQRWQWNWYTRSYWKCCRLQHVEPQQPESVLLTITYLIL